MRMILRLLIVALALAFPTAAHASQGDDCEIPGFGTAHYTVTGSAVKLSWTHPRSWRKLRRLVFYVMEDLGAEGQRSIGEVHVNVRHPRFETFGDVELARGSRMTRRGRTVSARVRLELDPDWKGSVLAYEFEAIDLRGHPATCG